MKGTPVTLRITKSGNTTDVGASVEYIIPLTDLQNKVWNVTVYEMKEITAEVKHMGLNEGAKLFSDISEDVKRRSCKVKFVNWHGLLHDIIFPDKVSEVGNLQFMQNQFGFCIR